MTSCHALAFPLMTSCPALAFVLMTSCHALAFPLMTSCPVLAFPLMTSCPALAFLSLTGPGFGLLEPLFTFLTSGSRFSNRVAAAAVSLAREAPLLTAIVSRGGLRTQLLGRWQFASEDVLAEDAIPVVSVRAVFCTGPPAGLWRGFWRTVFSATILLPEAAFLKPALGVADTMLGLLFMLLCLTASSCSVSGLTRVLGAAGWAALTSA
ncbi:unnamed protein product [Lymnaea stagnalis]|uniref:Uncharacterized protein n=1 Tax=Lymnaea stagnalis TaxID=6523 RepID=A0AAV2IH68_LYMST